MFSAIALMVALGVAADSSIAEGTAVDTLSAFVGEQVQVTRRDGSVIAGTLKSVSPAAVVIVQQDGVVVSLRPQDAVRLRLGRSPAAPSIQEKIVKSGTWSSAPFAPSRRFDWKTISGRLLAAQTRTNDIAFFSSLLEPREDCTYVLEEANGSKARIDLDGANDQATLVSPKLPTAASAIVGCGRRFDFDVGEIESLNRHFARAVKQPSARPRWTDAAEHARELPRRSPVTVAVDRDVFAAQAKYDDFEWARTGAIVTGIGGTAVSAAVATTGLLVLDVNNPSTARVSSVLYMVSSVIGSVAGLTTAGLAIKAYLDWEEAERLSGGTR